MRKPLEIPVRTIGPGSQPPDEQALEYLPFPPMEPLPTPATSASYDGPTLAEAARVVGDVRARIARWRGGDGTAPVHDLQPLSARAREAINDSLGQGEVSVIVHRPSRSLPPRSRIQETAFAGLWRVRHYDEAGEIVADLLEAADIPGCVRDAAAAVPHGFAVGPLPDGAMNARAVLRELAHHATAFAPGSAPHVVNLTLLPTTPQDQAAIEEHLGVGPVVILSRGFGSCRIASTAVRGVWRVQYFNSMQTLILDTIEVVEQPEVALAAPEDFDDTVERLADLVRWMEDDAAGDVAPSGAIVLAAPSVDAPTATGATAATATMTATPATTATSRSVATTGSSPACSWPPTRSAARATGDSGSECQGASVTDVDRYECVVCWYVYDPAVGDPVWQVPPGTPFSALPAHWSCPKCVTEKARFLPLRRQGQP